MPRPSALWVSPKIRTGQTLQALSQNFNLPLEVKIELDLRSNLEQRTEFKNRVLNFIESLSRTSLTQENGMDSDRCVFICTHYDWIEEAMALIPADRDLITFEYTHWAPAHYIHFKLENGLWQVLKKGDPR